MSRSSCIAVSSVGSQSGRVVGAAYAGQESQLVLEVSGRFEDVH